MRVFLESPTGKGTVRMVERQDTEDILIIASRKDGEKKSWTTHSDLAALVKTFEQGGFKVVEMIG